MSLIEASIQAPSAAMDKATLALKIFTREAFSQLVDGITNAIHASFNEFPMREDKTQELRRRFKICMDWALILRGDLKWGITRMIDSLPQILRTELGGRKWAPPERQCWIPEDGG